MVADVYRTGYCGFKFDFCFSISNLNFGPVLDQKMGCLKIVKYLKLNKKMAEVHGNRTKAKLYNVLYLLIYL